MRERVQCGRGLLFKVWHHEECRRLDATAYAGHVGRERKESRFIQAQMPEDYVFDVILPCRSRVLLQFVRRRCGTLLAKFFYGGYDSWYLDSTIHANVSMCIAIACSVAGGIAFLGWVGSSMLTAFGKDLGEGYPKGKAAKPVESASEMSVDGSETLGV